MAAGIGHPNQAAAETGHWRVRTGRDGDVNAGEKNQDVGVFFWVHEFGINPACSVILPSYHRFLDDCESFPRSTPFRNILPSSQPRPGLSNCFHQMFPPNGTSIPVTILFPFPADSKPDGAQTNVSLFLLFSWRSRHPNLLSPFLTRLFSRRRTSIRKKKIQRRELE